MRKVITLAAATVLVTGLAGAPAAMAATPKAGAKCTVKQETARNGTQRLYCGVNTNPRTKAKYKLAWINFTACFNGINEYRKTAAQYQDALAKMAEIKTQLAALDTPTQTVMAPQVQQLELAVAKLGPISKTLADGIRKMCP